MTNTSLKIIAIMFAFAPGLALAQSAASDPGNGSRIQQAPRAAQPLVGEAVSDPSVPGSGSKIQQVPRTSTQPLAADVQDPGKPGDGYRLRSSADSK